MIVVQAPVIEKIRAEVRLLGAGKVPEGHHNGGSVKTEDVTQGQDQNDVTMSEVCVTTPAANDSSPASVSTSVDNDKSAIETSGSDEAKSPAAPKQKLSAKGKTFPWGLIPGFKQKK